VYNVAGELVRKFEITDPATLEGQMGGPSCPPGPPPAVCGAFGWDGRNDSDSVVAPGLYLMVIESFDASGNRHREITKIAIQ